MDTTLQKPLEVADVVIASRPAVTLKLWAEWELKRARRLEAQALGQPPEPSFHGLAMLSETQREQVAHQQLAAALLYGPQVIKETASANEALYRYGLIPKIVRAADGEYDRYKKHYANNTLIYEQHHDELRGLTLEARADEDFLSLNLGMSHDLAAARQANQDLVTLVQFFVLKHYTDDQTAGQTLGPGQLRMELHEGQFSAAQWTALFDRAQGLIQDTHREQVDPDMRGDWLGVLERAQGRIGLLQTLEAPATQH